MAAQTDKQTNKRNVQKIGTKEHTLLLSHSAMRQQKFKIVSHALITSLAPSKSKEIKISK